MSFHGYVALPWQGNPEGMGPKRARSALQSLAR